MHSRRSSSSVTKATKAEYDRLSQDDGLLRYSPRWSESSTKSQIRFCNLLNRTLLWLLALATSVLVVAAVLYRNPKLSQKFVGERGAKSCRDPYKIPGFLERGSGTPSVSEIRIPLICLIADTDIRWIPYQNDLTDESDYMISANIVGHLPFHQRDELTTLSVDE